MWLWGLLPKTSSVKFSYFHTCPRKTLFLLDVQTSQYLPPELVSIETQQLPPQGNVTHSIAASIGCFHAQKLSMEDSQNDVHLLVYLGLSQLVHLLLPHRRTPRLLETAAQRARGKIVRRSYHLGAVQDKSQYGAPVPCSAGSNPGFDTFY